MGLYEGGYFLEYQPIIRLSDESPVAAEALVRLEHRGKVYYPGEFLPGLGRMGGYNLGRWVLSQACRDCEQWRQTLGLVPDQFRVSVNISLPEILVDGWLRATETAIAQTGLPYAFLQLEVVEGQPLVKEAAAKLRQLQEKGVRFAADDVDHPYGFANATLFMDLLEVWKTSHGLCEQEDWGRLGDFTHTAEEFGKDLVVEGISYDQARHFGCRLVQSFAFGRPAKEPETVAYLARFFKKA